MTQAIVPVGWGPPVDWVTDQQFPRGCCVVHNGALWRAEAVNRSTEPGTSDDWTLVSGTPYGQLDLTADTISDGTGIEVVPAKANTVLWPSLFAAIGDGENVFLGGLGWDGSTQLPIGNYNRSLGFTDDTYFGVPTYATNGTIAGNSPIGLPLLAFLSQGRVADTSIFDAGSGYTAGDTVVDPFSGEFHVTIDTVNGMGHVLTYHVTAVGTEDDFTVGENDLAMVGGTGTGFTLQVDSVYPVSAPTTLRVWYQELPTP